MDNIEQYGNSLDGGLISVWRQGDMHAAPLDDTEIHAILRNCLGTKGCHGIGCLPLASRYLVLCLVSVSNMAVVLNTTALSSDIFRLTGDRNDSRSSNFSPGDLKSNILNLAELPPELLSRITQWLNPHDLCSVALTNNLLGAVAEQWLYRIISINAGESSDQDYLRFMRLCKTLNVNKGKADLVRALEVKDLR